MKVNLLLVADNLKMASYNPACGSRVIAIGETEEAAIGKIIERHPGAKEIQIIPIPKALVIDYIP